MCGIFGYFSSSEVSMDKVLELLCVLEKDHYEKEDDIGGHGAGVSFLDDSGKIVARQMETIMIQDGVGVDND